MSDDYYKRLSLEEHVRLEYHNSYRQKKARFLNGFLPPTRGAFIDVGCGSGFDLYHLVRYS